MIVHGDRGVAVPFYIACDASASMRGSGIAALQGAIQDTLDILAGAAASDLLRVAVVSFNDSVTLPVPLTSVETLPNVSLEASGVTNLGALLRYMKDRIKEDVRGLKSEGLKVYRPTLIIVTDGYPTDDWRAPLTELISPFNRERPKIIAIGIREADTEQISELGVTAGFVADASGGLGPQLRALSDALSSAMIATVSATSPQLAVPKEIPHFVNASP